MLSALNSRNGRRISAALLAGGVLAGISACGIPSAFGPIGGGQSQAVTRVGKSHPVSAPTSCGMTQFTPKVAAGDPLLTRAPGFFDALQRTQQVDPAIQDTFGVGIDQLTPEQQSQVLLLLSSLDQCPGVTEQLQRSVMHTFDVLAPRVLTPGTQTVNAVTTRVVDPAPDRISSDARPGNSDGPETVREGRDVAGEHWCFRPHWDSPSFEEADWDRWGHERADFIIFVVVLRPDFFPDVIRDDPFFWDGNRPVWTHPNLGPPVWNPKLDPPVWNPASGSWKPAGDPPADPRVGPFQQRNAPQPQPMPQVAGTTQSNNTTGGQPNNNTGGAPMGTAPVTTNTTGTAATQGSSTTPNVDSTQHSNVTPRTTAAPVTGTNSSSTTTQSSNSSSTNTHSSSTTTNSTPTHTQSTNTGATVQGGQTTDHAGSHEVTTPTGTKQVQSGGQGSTGGQTNANTPPKVDQSASNANQSNASQNVDPGAKRAGCKPNSPGCN